MLSPGEFWKRVPKGRKDNLRFRRFVFTKARKSKRLKKALVEACRQDILLFVNVFVWQYNPRKKGGLEVGPFITWPFQDEALKLMLACVENDDDLVIEKSREMGASWMLLIVFVWLFLFHPWQKFLLISRNEKAVEDEDPDSLFWKIDFILHYLPAWLKPRIKRRKLFYGNDDLGSTITGQASTGQAGVGGRATAMGIDEFSQIKEDYEVLHRTSDTTGCRIFNGTHLGLDTALYELTQRVDIKKLRLHWTQHPDKIAGLYRANPDKPGGIEVLDKGYQYGPDFNFVLDGSPVGGPHPGIRSPWYDEQCRRKGSSRAVAMDLDINPSGSVSQFFDPLVIRELQGTYCVAPYWEGDVVADPETGKVKDMVRRPGGPLQLWINLDKSGKPPTSAYTAGADIAAGTGATPSCLTILDARTGEKALEFTSAFIKPEEFALVAVALCWLFKDDRGEPAMLCWEMQGPGTVFGLKVIALGFRSIYWRTNEQKVGDTAPAKQPGWYPAGDNRRIVLEDYRLALRTRQFVNRSHQALEETLMFRYSPNGRDVYHPGHLNDQDPSRAGVNHGDHVIADALAWKMAKGSATVRERVREEESPIGSLAWRRQLADARSKREGAWA